MGTSDAGDVRRMSDQPEQSLALREAEVDSVPDAAVEVVDDDASIAQIKAAERFVDVHHAPDRAKVRLMRTFLKAYERTGSIGRAAQEAGISRVRLNQLRMSYRWFNDRVEALFNTFIEDVESTAYSMATDGQNQVMTRWYLERAAPQKWGKAQEKGNGPPLTIHIEQNVYDAI